MIREWSERGAIWLKLIFLQIGINLFCANLNPIFYIYCSCFILGRCHLSIKTASRHIHVLGIYCSTFSEVSRKKPKNKYFRFRILIFQYLFINGCSFQEVRRLGSQITPLITQNKVDVIKLIKICKNTHLLSSKDLTI